MGFEFQMMNVMNERRDGGRECGTPAPRLAVYFGLAFDAHVHELQSMRRNH
jgi:hypothetical protein